MKQIYTKTGDQGQTSLRGGQRVPKDDVRIEANGQLDMLNALLGLLVSQEPNPLLEDIQRELMTVMSHVATPDGQENPRQLHCEELIYRMEQAIDAMNQHPAGFVLPRGILHVARAQCRTAERRLWTVHREHPLEASILRMINRLSDYLFVLAYEKQ
ncbi:MAG: cob(I)yrinic acid a,c-diamide adenosyltransferase [Prevotella sp.]|nr:cob(I)yrinic acid a,c-diamide adenosyltransferase [Prevotella sp.]